MTQGAVYDAINAITPKHHRPYLLNRRFSARRPRRRRPPRPRRTASSPTSSPRCPRASTFPNRASLLTSLATQYDAYLAAGQTRQPFKGQGIAAGNAAADAMIAAREGDGRFGPSQWDQNTGSGALAAAVAERDVAARPDSVGRRACRPFLMRSSSQFRTRGPQRAHQRRVRGGLQRGQGARRRRWTSSARTADQTHNAVFWQSAGGPALLWNGVARQPGRGPGPRARRRRQCPPARDDEPERRGRGDQLLERQVPLRLLAAVAGDPPGGPRTATRRRRPTRRGRRC